jgi:DNA-binding XRE family transcriptional regulator
MNRSTTRGFRLENRIRNFRILSRYSQKDLANLLGVPQKTLSRWEEGQRKPGVYYAVGLGVALHRMVDDIFYPYRQEWVKTIGPRARDLVSLKAKKSER